MELTKTIKRLLSVVLCLVMCFSLLPAAAFADVGDESAQTQEDAAAIPGEDGEIVVDGEEGDLTDGDGLTDGDNDLTDGDGLTDGDDSLTDGDLTGGDGLTGDNGLPEGGNEGDALPEGGALDDGDDALSEGESEPDEDEPSETVVLGLGGGTLTGGADGLADSDTLLAGYFDSLTHSAGGRRKAPAATAGSRLSGPAAKLYAALAEKIAQVARGELDSTSTAFTVPVSSLEMETIAWPLEELGLTDDPIFGEDGYITETASRALNEKVLEELSFFKVIQALVADHPYEMFWYDKTRGCAFNFYITYDAENAMLGINELGDFFTSFYVAQEYATDTFAVNRELIQSVNTAAANAKSIVTAHAADADRAKLLAYLTEICALVSYNYDALGENVPYGNPWQLVWVFDGDSATNVVCEGYAKAFQYLCDLSAFASNRVRCLSVSGLMSGGTGAGRHMWNVVRLDNGVNYLVDATNCDEGSIGAPDALFLAVPTGGDAESGYTFSAYGYEIDYSYDEDLLDLYDAEDLAIGVPPARPVTASGSCGAEGDNLTWTLYEDGELVIEGTGEMQDYTRGGAPWYAYRDAITRAVFEEGVTSISEEAFFGCNSLTTVSLPNTLTSLNSWSFNSCGITEIFIPASVNWISASAFYFTQSLQRIDVDPDNQSYKSVDGVVFSKDGTVLEQYPDARQGAYSVPEGVTTIGPVAFYGSNGLTGLTLPSTLTTIKHRAFYGVGISSVLIPASVTTIESGAFAACDSLTAFAVEAGGAFTADEQGALYTADMSVLVQAPAGFSGDSFVVPDGVKEIQGDALHGAKGITYVYIPASVTKIGQAAFISSGLKSAFYGGSEIDWNLVTIEDGNDELREAEMHFSRELVARGNCGADAVNLTWALFKDGELVIEGTGEMAFYTSGGAPWYEHRELITAVTVREGVSSIAEKAFYGCDKLASLSLPSSLEKMPDGVLTECAALAQVTVAEGNARFRTEDGVVYDRSTLLWCPRDKSGSFAIPLGTAKIGENAFAGCTALSEITIPAGVTYLEYGAFSGCAALQTVELPFTVRSIRYNVFSGCGALTLVRYSGDAAMWNKIEIASGNDALLAAERVCAVFERPVEDMGVSNGGNVTWTLYKDGEFVAEGSGPFDPPNFVGRGDADLIREVTIGEGITAIGSAAFDECHNLETIRLPSTLREIGWRAFDACIGIKRFIVAPGCTAFKVIDEGLYQTDPFELVAYPKMNGATSCVIPTGVTRIRQGAFQYCQTLQTVTIPSTVTTIEEYAFNCCILSELILPEGLKSFRLGDSALCSIGRLSVPASLEFLTFSQAVAHIGSITVAAKNPKFASIDGVLYSKDRKTLFYCPDGKTGTLSIPAGVTTIDDGAFPYDCQLEQIDVPASVTSVPDDVFDGCLQLKTLNIAAGCTAFRFADGLLYSSDGSRLLYCARDKAGAVAVPEGQTQIPDGLFAGCTQITEISLPASLTYCRNCFYTCSSLQRFTVAEGNEKYYTVDGFLCRKQNDTHELLACPAGRGGVVEIPAEIKSISGDAFSGCSGITAFTVAEGNTAFRAIDGVLYSADGSRLVLVPPARGGVLTLPEGVTRISYGFPEGVKITGLVLPASLSQIDPWGLSDASELVSVTVAADNPTYRAIDGVLYSKDASTLVLMPCGRTGSYTIPAGVTVIGESAFLHSGVSSIVIPESVTTIERWAFPQKTLTDVWYGGSQADWEAVTIRTDNLGLFHAAIHFHDHVWGESVYTWAEDFGTATASRTCTPWPDHVETETVETTLTVITEPTYFTPGAGIRTAVFTNPAFAPQTHEVEIPPLERTAADGGSCGEDGAALTWTVYEDGGLVIAGSGALGAYDETSAPWRDYLGSINRLDLEPGVTEIGDGAFAGCAALKTVTIPTGVARIGADAFRGCGALEDVFFDGTREQWDAIAIESGNEALSAAALHLGVYVIRFDPNGGENAPQTQTKRHGEALTLPTEIPTRAFYSFLGWSAEADSETADYLPGGSYAVDGDVTLYAVWQKIAYTLRFRTNGASGAAPADVSLTADDGAVTLPGAPTRAYYNFTGWNTAADGMGESFDGTADATALIGFADAQHVVTLYARWELVHYTIVFDPNGGEGETEAQPMRYSIAAHLNANGFTRVGYAFAGWNTRPDGKGKSYADGAAVNNLASEEGAVVTLYARWKANSYTVHFDANSGTGTMKDLAMTYGKAKALTANVFKKTNWQFVGWSEDPAAKEPTYADKQTVSDLTEENGGAVTLYAVWVKNSYRILFNANGGTGDMSEESAWCEYDGTYTLPRCGYTRAGFDFLGWATAAKGKVVYDDAAQISALTAKNGKVITLYAVWRAHRYNISFDGNGATSGGTKAMSNLACGKAYTLTANGFTRKGYTFLGWSEDENATEATYKNKQKGRNFSTADGDTVKLYAVWTPTVYKITYKNVAASDGNVNPASYTITDETIVLQGLSRPGCTFEGWYLDAKGKTPVMEIPAGSTGARTLYAKWSGTAVTYSVMFDPNEGTGAMKPQSMTCGKTKALTANAFKRAGYAFAGWNTRPDGSGVSYADKQSVLNLSETDKDTVWLYAQWKAVTYKITYKNVCAFDTNDNPASYSLDAPVDFNHLSPAARPGCAFKGWYTDAKCTKSADTASFSATGAKTLYAKWSGKVTYTIRFDPNSVDSSGHALLSPVKGTMKSLTRRTNGTVYTLTKNAFKCAGYTFKGWMTEDGTLYGNKAKVGNLADANGTVTLYAVWEPTAYTITYKNVVGARVPGKTSYTIEESYVLPVPEKEGCVFLGWYTSATFKASTRIRELGPGATGNKTLYAKWMLKADPAGDSGGDSLPTG